MRRPPFPCLPLSGVIFGAGNTAATLAGFISVPATGFILQVGLLGAIRHLGSLGELKGFEGGR